jgi:hypothetical protein
MKRSCFIILVVLCFSVSLHAQLAMGKWRTHLTYSQVNQIALSDNKVFALSEGALFAVSRADESLDEYTKISGLSDNDVSAIEMDQVNKQLLLVYSNGNIDLLTEAGVVNIPDYMNKQLTVNKAVNDICIYNNNAYLACNFGILVFNLKKKEISETYYIGNNSTEVTVLNTVVHAGMIYAVTADAVYRADINSSSLVNYASWTSLTNLPGSGVFRKALVYNNKLFLQRGGSLFMLSDGVWSQVLTDTSISEVFTSGEKMFVYSNATTTYLVDENLNKTTLANIGEVADAVYDGANNRLWFAGKAKGVISCTGAGQDIRSYMPTGPLTNMPWFMAFSNQKLYVLQGGRWAADYARPGHIMMYENNAWTNIKSDEIEAVTGYKPYDFMNIAFDPADSKHYFITSYGTGLYEFRNESLVKWHTYQNSAVETILQSNPYRYMRVDGAVFDKAGNLFFTNTEMQKSIKVLLNTGEWVQLAYPNANLYTISKILISDNDPNQKWVLSTRAPGGLLVFSDNGTIKDQSDDKSIFFTSFADADGGSAISPSYFYCITQDADGVIWVGTDQGPLLFYNTSKVFDSGYTCTRVKIARNDGTNQADYLLQSEAIKSIAIDGANRKWIGTDGSGVYLMSADGQTTIKHFTADNSPLLSNSIMSISINPKTGEVFFGTSKGLISYQADATASGESFDDVHAYPNPVRENYTGVVTITGLVKNTQVKITDLNGNLIFETKSNGGVAVWDVKNSRGRKVSTGIYLALCVNEDGTESIVTKIMVIN